MNNHEIYTAALAKLAALVEQQNNVTTKQHEIGGKIQAARSGLDEANKQADAVRGKVLRGIATDGELAAADIDSEKLFAQVLLDELRADEKACRDELRKLDGEMSGARAAVTAALQKLCCGIADQLGDKLKKDLKLRAALVDIYAACCAMTDPSLGGTYGGRVDWVSVLDDIFPEPVGAELDTAYGRFKDELAK